MTIKKRIKQQPDETPEEFFAAVKVPESWKFEKWANWDSTFGKVYLTKPGIFIRLFFDTIPNRGGLCECDTRNRKQVFTCLVSNKRSDKLNEWINNNLINEEDDNEEN
jgi:hypothetical protein